MTIVYNYVQNLADNTLVLGQRLSEWCGIGPFLEEELALTNTALDTIGQAKMLVEFATELKGEGTADDLAFMISEKIQDEMQYPGQIKVTVIREKRAISFAR